MASKRVPKSIPSHFDIYNSVRQAAGQMDLLFHEFLTEQGLTLSQYLVLDAISKEEVLTPMQISQELCVSPASITYTCQSLIKSKLIIKKVDKADRRSMNVKLTAGGKKLLSSLSQSLSKISKEFMEILTEREMRQLYTKAERLKDHLPTTESAS
jgi:DNA-binding MarR family transcriptional regulator